MIKESTRMAPTTAKHPFRRRLTPADFGRPKAMLLASSMLHTATKNRMGMKNSSAYPKNTAPASRPEGP